VVTHQLQVERRTAKAHWPKTDALPLNYATNLTLLIETNALPPNQAAYKVSIRWRKKIGPMITVGRLRCVVSFSDDCHQNLPLNLNIAQHLTVIRKNMTTHYYLWPPYVIGQAIIFLPCGFFLSSIYLSFLFLA